MSLFGSLMGDFDEDLGFMGNHMNAMNMQMRSMNRLMNSLMPDPFNMLAPFDPGFQQNAIMERNVGPPMGLFGFPPMPNMNRLLSADIGANGASYCSSSVISMSSGPDGRPQIYQATSSTKTGPGGVRETRRTVQDSTKGIKKMAIGHHIGERAHIIEKEQHVRSGQLEERQEFINLDEDDAEDFDREFTNKVQMSGGPIDNGGRREMLSIEPAYENEDQRVRHHRQIQQQQQQQQRRQMPTLQAPPQQINSSTTESPTLSSPLSSSCQPMPCATLATNHNTANTLSSTQTSLINHTNNTNSRNDNNNNNNFNMNATPRRAFRGHVIGGGATPRRPLRTPSSSPLATTTNNHHNHSTVKATTTTSVHPHPYNASAARRNYRSKHTKQHQQAHPHVELVDDMPSSASATTTTQQQPTQATGNTTTIIEEID